LIFIIIAFVRPARDWLNRTDPLDHIGGPPKQDRDPI